ncbi:DUF421 domain-containing protein [Paenibacillus gansuensis]|uniref:DUF421 domain-containing protein n=1 Tax=Paenibacillus gansuensis TaxID=306542 RepID=A0ABW5PFP8_9BACL
MQWWWTVVSAFSAYLYLHVLCRLLGRKVLSQFNFFDFASAITIGALTSQIAIPSKDWKQAALAVGIFTVLTLLLDYLIQKSPGLRSLVNSKPKMVIYKGQIDSQQLRKARLNLDELLTILRQKNVFHPGDVYCAILETDGQLSVLPKSDKMPITPSDLNRKPPEKGMMNDVIKDGNIITKNLRHAGYDDKWLQQKLREQGVQSIGEVFYAGVDGQGALYVSKRDKAGIESGNIYLQ